MGWKVPWSLFAISTSILNIQCKFHFANLFFIAVIIHPGYIYFQLYLATGSPASKLDQNATNGVVQVLDEVMFPPRTSFWGLFDSNFSIFKQLIENVDLSIEFIGEFDSYALLVELLLNEFVVVFEIVVKRDFDSDWFLVYIYVLPIIKFWDFE